MQTYWQPILWRFTGISATNSIGKQLIWKYSPRLTANLWQLYKHSSQLLNFSLKWN